MSIGEISKTGTGDPGAVTRVTPTGGTPIDKGSAVALVVVPSGVEVPDVQGLRTGEARRKITAAGLKVGQIRWRFVEHRPANLVLSQDPEPGVRIPPEGEVHLVLNEE